MSKELRHTNDAAQAPERIPYATPSDPNYGAVRDLTAGGSKNSDENGRGAMP
ncbi:MAG: hypothetical protein IPH14_05810 [Thermomonas sp.]|jgi:hypothetical protein|uniref:hypothetical protein n=1 Tax=Thermomonas sp. TaxID=1971895 RepID=UPI0025E8A990|nr:hypothetical protein [Thermomonas sp.]MBK6924780.1 hypothetical protein [Thermomonas sp.]